MKHEHHVCTRCREAIVYNLTLSSKPAHFANSSFHCHLARASEVIATCKGESLTHLKRYGIQMSLVRQFFSALLLRYLPNSLSFLFEHKFANLQRRYGRLLNVVHSLSVTMCRGLLHVIMFLRNTERGRLVQEELFDLFRRHSFLCPKPS